MKEKTSGALWRVYFLPRILNTFVPHLAQVPDNAFRPFFSLTSLGFFISRLALHFTQYAVSANHFTVVRSIRDVRI